VTLEEFVQRVSGFGSAAHGERILLFGWYLHTQKARERFDKAAVRACFDQLHLTSPDLSVYFKRMVEKKPPSLLSDRGGYRLAAGERSRLDKLYGQSQARVHVEALIAGLPAQIPGLSERAFLAEVIACFGARAYRAAIVMSWNLALDHVMHWILADTTRLARFNAAIPARYPKNNTQIVNFDDFENLKEFDFIEVLHKSDLVSGGVTKILKEKLGKRNSAAHPSSIEFTQFQAEEAITDLVNNVVLKLV
jgi:hypothetical protein